MKASRFSDAQKAFILKQGADGMPVADICRKAGISQATYFIGRSSRTVCCRPKCGGEVARGRELETAEGGGRSESRQ